MFHSSLTSPIRVESDSGCKLIQCMKTFLTFVRSQNLVSSWSQFNIVDCHRPSAKQLSKVLSWSHTILKSYDLHFKKQGDWKLCQIWFRLTFNVKWVPWHSGGHAWRTYRKELPTLTASREEPPPRGFMHSGLKNGYIVGHEVRGSWGRKGMAAHPFQQCIHQQKNGVFFNHLFYPSAISLLN